MDEVAGWDWIYAQAAKKAQTKRPKVCFTGFSAVDRALLVALADQAGFDVADSVSASLSYLCAGENAGPAKLAKAKAAGCMILTETAFQALLETGELPRQTAN